MKNILVYPGTFDPLTLGHCDLVERASRLVDNLIVAIAAHTSKTPVFSLEQRIAMAQSVFESNKKVQVIGFEGLLMDFVIKMGAQGILRGLRAVSDFEYEFQLASMNRHLAPHIETLFLTPDQKYAFISSSLVREVASLGGNIKPFVPDTVATALQQYYQ